ncbi:DUF2339 domain-containing protein [Paenibacillus piri]|nr:DUF2339 domain-containing protein [Paenibacillus piri]
MNDELNKAKASPDNPLLARVEALEQKVSSLERQLHMLQQEGAATARPPAVGPGGAFAEAEAPVHGAAAGTGMPTASGVPDPSKAAGATAGTEAYRASDVPSAPGTTYIPGASTAPGAHEQRPQPPLQPPPPAPKPKPDWEHLIARVWLPRIFIAVLLIGVLWGFTAAVSAGIITEPIRCLLGVAAAGFMYWQGEAQSRRGRPALGQVLLGGSIAVLLLALFAAHMLYALIPAWLAFTLYVLAIGAGLRTALRQRSQALTVIMMLAGYLVPFLVDSAKPDIRMFIAYETVFSIAMLLLAHRFAYRAAYCTAFGVLHVPLLIGMIGFSHGDSRYPVMLALLLQHAVMFALSVFPREGRSRAHTVPLFLGFTLTAVWMFGLFADKDPFVYRLVIAACALVYSATAYVLLKRKQQAAVYMAAATFGWFLWIVHVLEASNQTAAVLVEGMLAIMLGVAFKSRLQQATGILAYVFGICSVILHPISRIPSAETFAWLVLLVSVGALYAFLKRLPEGTADGYKRRKNSLLWADSVLFLIFISQATDSLTKALSYDMQHLLLSAVWVLYAIAVIITGVVASKRKVRLAGILFLFLTLLKIIFIDLPDVSAAIRAVLFIGLGSIGVAVSRLFYKRKE